MNSGGASSPRAPTTSGVWVHKPPREQTGKQSSRDWLLLFLSSSVVRIIVTCNKRKTHKQQLIFSFPPCFQICFSPFSFFISASFSLQIPLFYSVLSGRR
jgi:hypothetical protein